MTSNLINWGDVKDRHILGHSPLGKLFIRLNRENKVSGMYTMFDNVEKFVPENESQESVEGAKNVMFKIVKNKIEQGILLKKDLKL